MLIDLTVVAASVLLLRVGLGLYLGKSSGREVVASRISSVIGLPVEIADIELEARTSPIKFRLLDPPLGTSSDAEIFSVETATADVSFLVLLTGRAYLKELHLQESRSRAASLTA